MPSSSVIGLGVILAVSAVLTTATASKVAYNGGPHSSSRKMTTFHYEDPSKFGEDCGDSRECLRSKCALLNVKSLVAEEASFKEIAGKKVKTPGKIFIPSRAAYTYSDWWGHGKSEDDFKNGQLRNDCEKTGWMSSSDKIDTRDGKNWLEMDLGELQNVAGVVTQGRGKAQWVTSVKISVSDDQKNYEWVDGGNDFKSAHEFTANTDACTHVNINFKKAINARYVRIYLHKATTQFVLKAAVLVIASSDLKGYARLQKEGDGTEWKKECAVWGKDAPNSGYSITAPKAFSKVHPWQTNNVVFGDKDCHTIAKDSDVRGIEFEVTQMEMQNRYKAVGLGRKDFGVDKNVPVISYGVYFQECKKCPFADTAVMGIYDRTTMPYVPSGSGISRWGAWKSEKEDARVQLGGEEAQAAGKIQLQEQFRSEHHHVPRTCHNHWHGHYRCDSRWNTKRSLPRWDYCEKAEHHELNTKERAFCGRVFNGDKVSVLINKDSQKFEVYVNGALRYRSQQAVVYPQSGYYLPAASFGTPDGEVLNTEWVNTAKTPIISDTDRMYSRRECYPRTISGDGNGRASDGDDSCKSVTRMAAPKSARDVLEMMKSKLGSKKIASVENVEAGFENFDYFERIANKNWCKVYNYDESAPAASFLELMSSTKMQCTADYADFSIVPDGKEGVFNGVDIREDDFFDRYNNGYLTEKVQFYVNDPKSNRWPADRLHLSVCPNGRISKFAAKFQCGKGNPLCLSCDTNTQFRVTAAILGKNVTQYNVRVNGKTMEYCDCEGMGKCGGNFNCNGRRRRRRLLTGRRTKVSGGC
eukprot:Stramenopile-MAST_4_protein_3290